MPVLGDLLAAIDAGKRHLGRNLSDLINDPRGYLANAAEGAAETLSDPYNYVGIGGVRGIGRLPAQMGVLESGGQMFHTPSKYGVHQAARAGDMRSLGLINAQEEAALKELGAGTNTEVPPALMRSIQREALARKQREMQMRDQYQMEIE